MIRDTSSQVITACLVWISFFWDDYLGLIFTDDLGKMGNDFLEFTDRN